MTPTSEQVAAHTVLFLDRMEQEELAIVRCAANISSGRGRGRCCAGRAVMYRRRATIRSISIRTRW